MARHLKRATSLKKGIDNILHYKNFKCRIILLLITIFKQIFIYFCEKYQFWENSVSQNQNDRFEIKSAWSNDLFDQYFREIPALRRYGLRSRDVYGLTASEDTIVVLRGYIEFFFKNKELLQVISSTATL